MADVRVMIIDDSALAREILTQGLAAAPGVQVVGTAADPYEARDRIVALRPDVLTLDVEMPRMNGVEFLRQLMPQYPLPVIMVSAHTERGRQVTLGALAAGAFDFVAKPRSRDPQGLQQMLRELHGKILAASRARIRRPARAAGGAGPSPGHGAPRLPDEVLHGHAVVVGASTGGTEALARVVAGLPAACPPVLAVQHMPAGFTRIFAERIDGLGPLRAREAVDGDEPVPGHLYLAPGGVQMTVVRRGGRAVLRLGGKEKIDGHCPSVTRLMESAATVYGADAVGVVLTGMGRDGASGLKRMRDAGARTLAQDEESCVVFGMPRVAWESGAAERLVPLDRIAGRIMTLLGRSEERV